MQLHCTHPNLKVIVQDKAPVIEQAASVWKERYPKAVSQGTAKLMTHDFFQKSPVSGAEIYWLRHILYVEINGEFVHSSDKYSYQARLG